MKSTPFTKRSRNKRAPTRPPGQVSMRIWYRHGRGSSDNLFIKNLLALAAAMKAKAEKAKAAQKPLTEQQRMVQNR